MGAVFLLSKFQQEVVEYMQRSMRDTLHSTRTLLSNSNRHAGM
jgi:hypothetical protein